ncbi:MAG: hypothetical protein U5K74_06600 [Gemmatimonadaceae bacterium]|nr:hypothetical protein [Gemmatimonadaceae bacterium]
MRNTRHATPVAVLLAAVLWGRPVSGQAPGSATSDSVGRVTARTIPDTVTVGQPFVVSLRAIPPRGRQAIAPAVPDTGGLVEPLDPANISRRGDTLLVRYRLIAWQPGVLAIPFGPVLMRLDSSEVSVPFDVRVVVASVLPADSAARVPRDSRALFPVATRWWERWWQWALVLLLALAAIYLFERWRRRDRTPKVAIVSPISRAEEAFARLDARRLPSAGEGGRHVALSAEIVRQALGDIEPSLALALTNAELLQAVVPIAGMPDRQLRVLLDQVDAVRFGATRVDAATVQRVSGLARELVRDIERVRSAMDAQAA